MTELQTPIWLDGNIDRKGPMQIETTPQDYGMSMGDVWVLYQMNVMKLMVCCFFFFLLQTNPQGLRFQDIIQMHFSVPVVALESGL